MMDVQEQRCPILIYYCFRGQTQAIRSLFCYLQEDFVEIHLERYEQQRKGLPKWVLDSLRQVRIDKSLLPILIDGGEMIFDVYAIMAYLCYKHNKESLLGSTCRNKARLQQVMEVYAAKQPQSMVEFFRLAQYVNEHTWREFQIQLHRFYQQLMNTSSYLKEFCTHVTLNIQKGFILGEITIIDFLFLESCIYMLGVFGHLDSGQQPGGKGRKKSLSFIEMISPENLNCLSVMRDYLSKMMNQPFYKQNKEFLQSFSVLSTMQSLDRIQGIRKLWIGDPKLIRVDTSK